MPATCFLCGAEVVEDDARCSGCGKCICERCNVNPLLARGHEPADHGDETARRFDREERRLFDRVLVAALDGAASVASGGPIFETPEQLAAQAVEVAVAAVIHRRKALARWSS
jgi:hypothetical protein